MVIYQPELVLTSINQDIGADFVDDPGDPFTVAVDLFNRGFREDFTVRSGITELVADVFAGHGPVVRVQRTLYIDPLADCRAFF